MPAPVTATLTPFEANTEEAVRRVEDAKAKQKTEYEKLPLRTWEVLIGSAGDENGVMHYAGTQSAVFKSRVDYVGRFGADKFREITGNRSSVRGLSSVELRRLADEQEALERNAANSADTAINPADPVNFLATLRSMSEEELRAWADGEGVDLGKAKGKDKILDVISKWIAEQDRQAATGQA